ncbi:twin-arginine translocation signal domain-containing protein [Shinella sp.]|uniref:twin-arginine translocation signal domain-containing protein n=1 Tax=Shinella sp. TaxID=1870904 RepID=UPI003F7025C3
MSVHQQHTGGDISRRSFLKSTAAAGVAIAAGGAFQSAAFAQDGALLKAYGVTTAQMGDPSLLTKATGVKLEFTGTDADIGVFMRDVMANNIGETHDILIFDNGTQNILGPNGFYAEIDTTDPELNLWDRTPDFWKKSDISMFDGKVYGAPILGNCDTFAYFPEVIGANPNGEDEIPYAVLYEDDRTRGRVALDRVLSQAMACMANFLKINGRFEIGDPANLTPEEAKAVVDYAIERKRAGQFRTFHNSFEEQVQLIQNREVDVLECWEPAVKEAEKTMGDKAPIYAFAVEGGKKWGHGAYVPAQAIERGNKDAIYKVLNYFLGGEFRAIQARDRGYAGPNMDLGVEYAKQAGWDQAQIDALQATDKKIERKMSNPNAFWSKPTAENADVMEQEWQRFLSA